MKKIFLIFILLHSFNYHTYTSMNVNEDSNLYGIRLPTYWKKSSHELKRLINDNILIEKLDTMIAQIEREREELTFGSLELPLDYLKTRWHAYLSEPIKHERYQIQLFWIYTKELNDLSRSYVISTLAEHSKKILNDYGNPAKK